MLCPYCEEEQIQLCGIYYCCHKCRIAMEELELAIAIRAKEDRDLLEKLSGQKVLQKEVTNDFQGRTN